MEFAYPLVEPVKREGISDYHEEHDERYGTIGFKRLAGQDDAQNSKGNEQEKDFSGESCGEDLAYSLFIFLMKGDIFRCNHIKTEIDDYHKGL